MIFFMLAQVNPNTPITFGDTTVHVSNLDYVFHVDSPLQEIAVPEFDEIDSQIGKIVAEELINDGDTCQFGKYNKFD